MKCLLGTADKKRSGGQRSVVGDQACYTWPKQFDVYDRLVYTYTRLGHSPEWRNWQTRTTQNRVGSSLVGSIPTSGIL